VAAIQKAWAAAPEDKKKIVAASFLPSVLAIRYKARLMM